MHHYVNVFLLCRCVGYGAAAGGYSNGGGAKANKPGRTEQCPCSLFVFKQLVRHLERSGDI